MHGDFYIEKQLGGSFRESAEIRLVDKKAFLMIGCLQD